MPSSPIDFQVNRDKFSDVRFDAGAPIDDLTEGQVLFKVNAFALTSNNISYAAAGDMLNYWGFFPGPDRWGRIPAMGFADVLASRNSEVTEGARVFGFFPMSRHLVIDAQPTKSGMITPRSTAPIPTPIATGSTMRTSKPKSCCFAGSS
ncbi:MAG: DUF2855 family protein [bacterium]